MERYFYLSLTLFLTVCGQLVVKSRSLELARTIVDGDRLRYLVAMFTDPLVLSGMAAAVVAGMSWTLAIQRTDLGYAYPFMALSFVLVPLAAAVLFKKQVSVWQTVGLAMIVAGVAISALTRSASGFHRRRVSSHPVGRSANALGRRLRG
jgi:drug/metabolite transporter (DMT)-like permease